MSTVEIEAAKLNDLCDTHDMPPALLEELRNLADRLELAVIDVPDSDLVEPFAPPERPMLYTITATVSVQHSEWTRTRQVPTFVLDGDMHGVTSTYQAEAFAKRMLEDLGPGMHQSPCRCRST